MTRYEAIKNLSVEDMAAWLNKYGFCITDEFEPCVQDDTIGCLDCLRTYLLKEVSVQ